MRLPFVIDFRHRRIQVLETRVTLLETHLRAVILAALGTKADITNEVLRNACARAEAALEQRKPEP